MANRFPLIVNPATKKIEEMVVGDNLDLTGNGLIANNTAGTNGQYLKTNGTTVVWDNPGDVYLVGAQTVTDKTFNACILSGSTNTFTNIPNTALVNSSIVVNGVAISLGGSVNTPDNNTTYSISAQDGTTSSSKIIRLTSGGNSGAGIDDDIVLKVASYTGVLPSSHKVANLYISRSGEEITLSASAEDTNTVTRLQSAVGGSLVSGDVTISASGSSIVSQSGNTINIESSYVDTITRLRGTSSGSYTSGDLTLLGGGGTTISQSTTNYTISSTDTVTRIRGGTSGTFVPSTLGTNNTDVTLTGAGYTTVSQVGNTITISSTDADTITKLAATGFALASGDFRIASSGSISVTQSTSAGLTTITLTGTDTNTTYSASANGGITESATVFSLKNSSNFTDSTVLKWDNSNKQFANSIITDNGSVVTINGGLTVTGSVTTIDTTTLVVSDNEIELRKGNNLVGTDSGIKVNRTTNASGVVQTFNTLQWYETGGYWRTYDGSIANRLVTENETQTLTNKTLTSPTLTTPTLGVATATTVNGLSISQTVSGTLTIANNKTLTANNTLTFSGTDGSTVGFGTGGTVVYTTNNLSVFASTTSAQLRGVMSDETGTGVLVFATSPSFTTSVTTSSTSFSVFNTTATTINAFGAATSISIGAAGGTTTIPGSLTVTGGTIQLGDVVGDSINVLGTLNVRNADIIIRDSATNPMAIGRGGNAQPSNTRVGFNALNANTTGSQNTAFGFEAALTINSGAGVVALGYRALRIASTGQYNIAIGRDSLVGLLLGERNVAVGANTLEGNTTGTDNVAIGHYAGAGATGSGNVLIGPAPDANSTNVTHTPPTPSGNNQLVIGSGTGTWIRGDSSFDVTMPQNASVGGNLTVSGTLTVNGTTTTINTNVLSVDDKEISLGDVSARTFTATIVSNSANISAISPVTGLIPGMVVSITTAGLSVPAGTTIVSITNNTATLSNTVTGSSGTATFSAQGATDTTADGGGIRIKGTTDKTIQYTNATTAFTASEHFDLATGKQYRIGNVQIANGLTTTLGPTSGSWSLGAGVTGSSLTSLGTLGSLNVSGLIASTFATVGSPALTFSGDTATGLANSTFSILKTVKGNIHFGNAAGTGGAARQAAITFRGNSTDEAQAGIYVINNNTIGTAMAFATTDNYTTGPQQGLTISHTGDITANRGNVILSGANKAFRSESTSSGDYVRMYAGGGTAQWDIYGNGENLRMGDNSSSATARVQFDNPTLHRSTSTTVGVAALTAKQEVNNGGYLIFDGKNSSDTTVFSVSHNGRVLVSDGIDFSGNSNAAGMTSELLNDYEEGTWTPSFVNGTFTYSVQRGDYTKVGNLVCATCNIQWSNKTGSGAFGITLPFNTGLVSTSRFCAAPGYLAGVDTAATQVVFTTSGNGNNNVTLYQIVDNGTPTQVNVTNLSTSGEVQFTISYMA